MKEQTLQLQAQDWIEVGEVASEIYEGIWMNTELSVSFAAAESAVQTQLAAVSRGAS